MPLMPPLQSLAQGACMAIEDGLCLGELIHAADDDFVAAFRHFETLRRTRTARVQLESLYGIGCCTPRALPATCETRRWLIGTRRTYSTACHGFMTAPRFRQPALAVPSESPTPNDQRAVTNFQVGQKTANA
jgi:hypothetical protein